MATDYEGLGTPGIPTDADGGAEGRAVLDSVRAVASLPDVGAIGDVVLAGHSQGAAAVLVASEIGSEYAPELDLVGTVALAPGADLPRLVDTLADSPYKGLVLIGASGLRAANPGVDLSSALTPSAMADLRRIETECVDATVERYRSRPFVDVFLRSPSSVPALAALLEANSPGSARTSVPLFIGHGEEDVQVSPDISARLQSKYCAFGVATTRRTYAGEGHDVIDAAADDVLAFMTARLARQPATTNCD